MNIQDLTDAELKLLLKIGIPIDIHRKIYTNKNLSKKIRGFRLNNIPLNALVNTSFSLIRNEKDSRFINSITDILDDYKEYIKKIEQNYIDNGYPTDFAHSIAIAKGYEKEFLPILFKLEDINEEQQKKIKDDEYIYDLTNALIDNKANDLFKDRIECLNKIIENNKKEANIKNEKLSKQIDELKAGFNNVSLKTDEFKADLKIINDKYVEKDELNLKLTDIEKASENEINKLANEIVKNDLIVALEERINGLEKEIKENVKNTNFFVENIKNDNYEIMEYNIDNLYYDIGTIISNSISGKAYELFKDFLLEIICSKNPVICSKNNSIKLIEILSSILTGGNYYTITLTNACTDNELIKELDSIPSVNNNKIVLIKNKVNVTDNELLLEYIKKSPINEKYVFEINYEKEILFMPIEDLNNYIFFLGKLKQPIINDKYSYSLTNECVKNCYCKEYEKILKNMGVELNNYILSNNKYQGVLAFSIIPFLAIHDNLENEELINKLVNETDKLSCKAVLLND